MKASEAQAILEMLDPDTEVTLLIGRAQTPKEYTPCPQFVMPMFPVDFPKNTITCKYVH